MRYNSCAAWYGNPTMTPLSVDDMRLKMIEFKAHANEAKARLRDGFRRIRCDDCGELVEYHESPERLVVCRCLYEGLKSAVPPRESRPQSFADFMPVDSFMGIRVDVRD